MDSVSELKNLAQTNCHNLAHQIRGNALDRRIVKQAYALTLLHSVLIAKACGIREFTAVELGVAGGQGLLTLVAAAEHFSRVFDIEIQIIGFDSGRGLPAPKDYRDHPELWHESQFANWHPERLQAQLGASSRLIIGDVADTVPEFCDAFASVIGFVAIDLDQYVSTKSALTMFRMLPDHYLPCTPVYLDDIDDHITMNPWAGESLAISEFNTESTLRKIHEKHAMWRIPKLHMLHVFDHPILTGQTLAHWDLTYEPF